MSVIVAGFAIVALFISVHRLQIRVRNLEEKLSGRSVAPVPSAPAPLTSASMYGQAPAAQPAAPVLTPAAPTGPSAGERFTAWLKEDWLMKLGALLLLIGCGWLTTYAFLNNWIGPMGRIVLGISFGVLMLVLGWWRIQRYLHQGGIFLVLGSTVLLLTVFAARVVYDFFTPFSALALTFLSIAFVAFVSVRYKNHALALASLILASVAPLLVDAPSSYYVELFSYLFIVVLGTLWVTVLIKWRALPAAALIMVALYSAPYLTGNLSADRGLLLVFMYAFVALFFITHTAGVLRWKRDESGFDLFTAVANGSFLLTWIIVAAQDEWKSLIIAAWMLVFTVGAFLIFRRTQQREPFYVYAGIGVAMLATATAAELEGAALVIAYIAEASILSLLSYFLLKEVRLAESVSVLLIAPIVLSFESISSPLWQTTVVHEHFFVLLLLGLALLGLGFFFNFRTRALGRTPSQLNAITLVVGSLYLYVLLWLSLHAALPNDSVAVMVALTVYTIIGIVFYFHGTTHAQRGQRLYGGTLVAFVVLRLLLVEVWSMELSGRIITFFLIGALLLSTAFLSKRRGQVLPS